MLLQTFEDITTADSILNKVNEVTFPEEIDHDTLRKMMKELDSLAKIEGADYTFSTVFSEKGLEVFIKRWLQRLKLNHIPGANVFEEDLRNFDEFIEHLFDLTEKVKNTRKDAVRYIR